MRAELTMHLTETALDDVLIGMGSAGAEAHLAACAECRAKVEEFSGDVRLFNAAAMAWSEAQPRRAPVTTHAAPVRRMPFALAGSVAAAVLAMVVGLSVGRHEGWFGTSDIANRANAVEDSQAQIAQDNQLMEAVNAAIGPQEESPIDEYGLRSGDDKHRKAK